jgi:hypothetical protein
MLTSTTEDGGFHLRWSAIFGGGVLALGVWVLLHALGMAAGLTAVDPRDTGSLRGAGIMTGVWSVLAPLVALFCGGWVAARTAGVVSRGTGAIHGAVVWGLATITGVFMVASLLGTTVRAGVKLGGAAVGGTSALAQAGGQGARAIGFDIGDLLGPINQRLEAQGLPAMTPEQIRAVTSDVVNRGLREGRLDRDTLAASLAANTQLDDQQVQQIASELQAGLEARAGQLKEQAQATALEAADTMGKVMWGVFLGLLLGLVSAVFGAVAGTSRSQRAAAEHERGLPVVVETTPAPTAPIAGPPVPVRP